MARTHDAIYLDEDRYERVKENFKFCRSFIPEHDRSIDIYDFGCAAGEFCYYLARSCPSDRIHGVDLLPELIEKARQNVSGATFAIGSVLDPSAMPAESADISFLIGVHPIFDDPTECFGNLITWTKRGGRIIIFSLFNPDPVDVFLQVRPYDKPASHREAGWNMISQATVSAYLASHSRVAQHVFHKFTIGIDLPRQVDPLRSWSEKMNDGTRMILNGTGLVHHFYALVVDLV